MRPGADKAGESGTSCNGIGKPGRWDPAGEMEGKRMGRQTDAAGHHNNLSLNTAERQGTITSAQRLLELTFPLLILLLIVSLLRFLSLDLLCC